MTALFRPYGAFHLSCVLPQGFSVCVRTILPPLRGLIVSHFLPTAYAVGFNLAPLRG